MRTVATDVARSVVCCCLSAGHDRDLCKTAEQIGMPFRGKGQTGAGRRGHY